VCVGCGEAVPLSKEKCVCGVAVAAEARVAGAFLEQTGGSLEMWQEMEPIYHCMDWRMVELGEAAMAEALDLEEYSQFVSVGEKVLEAYRQYWPPYSVSLGLHLAKIAKAALYIEQEEIGLDYLREATDIFSLSLGKSSDLVSYCLALKHSVQS